MATKKPNVEENQKIQTKNTKKNKKEQESTLKKQDTSAKKSKNKTLRNFLILIIKIIIIILTIYIIFGYIFGLKRVDSISMNPNIKEGDLVVFYRIDKRYAIGDVVALKKDNKDYILRIAATSGQTVSINDKKELLVDGYLEPYSVYYQTKIPKSSKIKFPYKVPEGQYFVLSDYRTNVNDSRTFGAINKGEIKGTIIGKLQVRNF